MVVLVTVTMAIYGTKTLQRNHEWTDIKLLSESAIAVNPTNAKVYMTIGNYYAQQVCKLIHAEVYMTIGNYYAL